MRTIRHLLNCNPCSRIEVGNPWNNIDLIGGWIHDITVQLLTIEHCQEICAHSVHLFQQKMITLFYQMGLSYWFQKCTRLKLRVHVPVPNSELTSQSRAQFPVFRVPSKFPRLLPVAWRRLCAQMPPLAPSRVSCRVFVIFRIPRIILISIKKNRQTCVKMASKFLLIVHYITICKWLNLTIVTLNFCIFTISDCSRPTNCRLQCLPYLC